MLKEMKRKEGVMKGEAFFRMFLCLLWMPSSVALAGFAAPSLLWPKTQLRTCFTSSKPLLQKVPKFLKIFAPGKVETFESLKVEPFSTDLKTLIQKSVKDSFSHEKTGIEFIGWGECDLRPGHESDFDVAIFYVQDSAQRKSLANEPGSDDYDLTPYIAATDLGYLKNNVLYRAPKFNPEQTAIRINASFIDGYRSENISKNFLSLLQWTHGPKNALSENWKNYGQYRFARDVVHEFAHVTGLMHEQQRSNLVEMQKYDTSYQQTLSADLAEQSAAILNKVGVSYGEFNPFSTMNYLTANYQSNSEKTRLICGLLKRTGKPSEAEKIYLLRIASEFNQQSFNKKLPTQTNEVLQKVLCADLAYLDFNPQSLAERAELLNDEDQELLRMLYRLPADGSASKAIQIHPGKLRKDISFLNQVWKKLIQIQW